MTQSTKNQMPPSAINPQPSTYPTQTAQRVSPHAKLRVAYVLACSHSGSTLLAMLLGAHPDACTIGELKLSSLGDIDCYRCSCGELIVQCAFWSESTSPNAAKEVRFQPPQFRHKHLPMRQPVRPTPPETCSSRAAVGGVPRCGVALLPSVAASPQQTEAQLQMFGRNGACHDWCDGSGGFVKAGFAIEVFAANSTSRYTGNPIGSGWTWRGVDRDGSSEFCGCFKSVVEVRWLRHQG